LNKKRLDAADEKIYESPRVVRQDLTDAYRTMAAEDCREAEAHEWAEATIQDITSALQQKVRRNLPDHHSPKDDPTRRHL
jgi:hypothetical protein